MGQNNLTLEDLKSKEDEFIEKRKEAERLLKSYKFQVDEIDHLKVIEEALKGRPTLEKLQKAFEFYAGMDDCDEELSFEELEHIFKKILGDEWTTSLPGKKIKKLIKDCKDIPLKGEEAVRKFVHNFV